VPVISIKMVDEGYTREQKAEVVAGVTEVLVEKLGKRRESITVMIEKLDPEATGVGGKLLK